MTKKQRIGKSAKTLTPEGRVSYPHLLTPNDSKFGQGKYEVILMFPKDKDITPISNAVKEATKKQEEISGEKLDKIKVPVRDGDTMTDKNPEYAGHYIVKFRTKTKPQVVGLEKDASGKRKPITHEAAIYGGMFGMASFVAGYYEATKQVEKEDGTTYSKVEKGITCYLQNFLKTRDGEPFGGSTADQDFGDDSLDGDFMDLAETPNI